MSTSTHPRSDRAAEPVGIATFETYDEVGAAVDELAARQFPVERTTIVAKDIRLVEDITGRRGRRELTRTGAAFGAVVGALVGVLLGLFGSEPALVWPAVWGAILGTLGGAVLGYAGASLTQHEYGSDRRMRAACYELVVEGRWADEARSLVRTWRLSRPPERDRVAVDLVP